MLSEGLREEVRHVLDQSRWADHVAGHLLGQSALDSMFRASRQLVLEPNRDILLCAERSATLQTEISLDSV